MNALLIVCWLLAGCTSIPLLVLGSQCLLALLATRKSTQGDRKQVALIVPAHNEASEITHTLNSLTPQLLPSDRLVVVADNCQDETAALARDAGAEVVERQDAVRRGKGYALDAGVRYLEQAPPEVAIVFDADCRIEPELIDQLARTVDGTQRPVQALYLMRTPDPSGPGATVSCFAFLIKNWVRPRAMQKLGLPVLLTGTGMAFPWPIIRDAPLASGEIVEDLALGLELTGQGIGPTFLDQAKVWSVLPQGSQAADSQRTRWEHGYLSSMLRVVPRLIRGGCLGRLELFPVALDLLVPPLSLLVLASMVAVGILVPIAVGTQAWAPATWLLACGTFAGLGLLLAWWRFARELVPASSLFAIPGYVLSKISIYAKFIRGRETRWIRTPRDAETSDDQD